jgi:hypothetical protein
MSAGIEAARVLARKAENDWKEEFRTRLPEYTFFAVAVRYESPEPEPEEALEAYETVKRFREIAHSLLPPEARP